LQKLSLQSTRWICKKLNYFPRILSESRINRRIHRIPWDVWFAIFQCLSTIFTERNKGQEFAVDSFPVTCCAKNRIDKRYLFFGKKYIGYSAAKHRHFCGVKVHMVVTTKGEPVEVLFRPASENDLSVLWEMKLDLPTNSNLYADGAYTSYDLEDLLLEEGIFLLSKRREGLKRQHGVELEKMISSKRQVIETAFSCITGLLHRYIRARTETGFLIRLMSAVLAYSLSFLT
jgi:Transposase DDE domain